MHDVNQQREDYAYTLLKRIAICFYFLLTFFEPYYNQLIGSVTKYYIFGLAIFLLLDNPKLEFKNYHYCFILWFIYKLLTVLWTSNEYIFESQLLSQIGMILLFTVLTLVDTDKQTIDWIVFTMWGASAVIGILALFFSDAYLGRVEYRQVIVVFGKEIDPNDQAAFLLVGIAISIYFLFYRKHLVSKISSGIILVMNLYAIFLTGSRGGLVSAIVIGLFFIFFFEKKMSWKQKGIIWASVLAIVLIGYFIAKSFLPDSIFLRLFDFSRYTNAYEGGGTRLVLWRNVWELIWTDLNSIFGAGWGAYYGYNGRYSAVHNTYLAMWSDVGLIGLLLFFVPIVLACMQLLKRKKILIVALLIAGFLPSLFLDAIHKRFFWTPIMLVFMQLNILQKQKEER